MIFPHIRLWLVVRGAVAVLTVPIAVVALAPPAVGATGNHGVGASGDRVNELVSTDTNFNPIIGGKLSPDGSRAWYQLSGGAADGTSGTFSHFVADRGTDGWDSANVLPPASQLLDRSYALTALTRDLSTFAFATTHTGIFSDPTPTAKLVRVDGAASQQILADFPLGIDPVTDVVASDDLSHLALRSGYSLLDDHPAGTGQVYEVGGAAPRIVSVLPDGTLPACGVSQGGFAVALLHPTTKHWISRSGRRTFFGADADCDGIENLYARDDAGTLDPGDDVTLQLDVPPMDEEDRGSSFIQATGLYPEGGVDGNASRVFFRTSTRLVTDGARADLNDTSDVYRFTFGGDLDCITCVVPEADVSGPGGEATGVSVSEDGSRVYFTSRQQLVPGEGVADGSDLNLYVYDGELQYVATGVELYPDGPIGSTGSASALTPDGAVLVFTSGAPILPSYDPGACLLNTSGGPGCSQYYRYDDRDGSLVCMSCPPTAAARGDVPPNMIGNGVTYVTAAGPLSADGDRFVFRSFEPLVPQDVNGGSAPTNQSAISRGDDVYEWSDGRVGLLTDGITEHEDQTQNVVLDVSASGDEMLFMSFSALSDDVAAGESPSAQLYVARRNGGFPRRASDPRPCDGDGCQPTSTPRTSGRPLPSADLIGRGNVAVLDPIKLSVAALSSSQRRALASGRVVSLRVRVSRPGHVRASMTTRLNRRRVVAASGSTRARSAGVVRIGVRLSRVSRQLLEREGRLKVRLRVRVEGAATQRSSVLMLGAPASRRRHD